MGEVRPLPSPGDVFTDIRGEDRTMRVSYHADRGVLVVSLWVGGLCRGSFRLADGDLGRLISVLEAMSWAAASVAARLQEAGPPAPPKVEASGALSAVPEVSGAGSRVVVEVSGAPTEAPGAGSGVAVEVSGAPTEAPGESSGGPAAGGRAAGQPEVSGEDAGAAHRSGPWPMPRVA